MKLSVFDLDHTLVQGNSSYQFCRYLIRRKALPISSLFYSAACYLKHHFYGMSLFDMHQNIFNKFLIGRSLDFIEKHVEIFVEQYLPHALYMPAVAELKLAQHLGHHTVILSNSPSFVVGAIAKFLGVKEWAATEYGVDKDQRLYKISSVMQGEEKASFVRQFSKHMGIKKEDITAYSDSHLDLPFLLSAGNAVAVNPNRKLHKLSQKKHWKVI
ncbi:MAG TPA: HAD-IB family hydrolase [Rhabdochlamydiaceae bacterium]|nr:HAD-IB family hydrolase [Rhabdochlamydiaceae bacterium]